MCTHITGRRDAYITIIKVANNNNSTTVNPARIINKKKSFATALESGVDIVAGGDVGVFSHGDKVLELELMVEYGMKPIDVLRSVTKVNAQYLAIQLL